LLEFADSYGADLIVAGSERKGRWGSLFMGSVTRALAIYAKESFLVAKGPHEGSERVATVIATDHSEYCDRCIERLLKWAPEGIGKLTIMTAQWTDISMLEMALKVSNLDPSELHHWIAERTESKNRELAQKFEAIGIPCETRVIQAEPREAIEIAMRQAGAELLVIGAQGHGLTDRITVGSVAMHEVVSSPHSVLVMRA
jgi:nucleotide-binding universal stress UspA family protein